jgi:formate hydrogenlyase transcriptional activator
VNSQDDDRSVSIQVGDSGLDKLAPEGVPQPLVLGVWEAVSTERSVQRVLEAAADVLMPDVPFASVGLFSFGTDAFSWLYVVGVRYREGETPAEYLARPEFTTRRFEVPSKPSLAYPTDERAMDVWTTPHGCADVLTRDAWYEHERIMATSGVRAYACVPLFVRGALIGSALFTRTQPVGFSDNQMSILLAASRALAVAVSNAVANDEIQKLRDELHAENLELKAQLGQAPWFAEIAGDSAAMRNVLARVEQVATTDATVLITGETGTGKELLARAIHRRSPRANGPLVKVNCAAIPDTLLASELFGHERGAFTGATERRRGRFEQAHRGTLFLDEIGELPPAMQVTLLRVLQEREFERLGGSQTVHVDVRVVAATNRDLAADVQSGRFRSDLYYRLNVFPVHIPPLRERPDDVAPLVAALAAKHAERLGRAVTRIDSRTLRRLTSHSWPGNVRELENVVERALILSRGGTLRVDRESMPAPDGRTQPLSDQVQSSERTAIERALAGSRGRISGPHGAARKLGLPASTLEFRIRKLGIDKHRYRKT